MKPTNFCGFAIDSVIITVARPTLYRVSNPVSVHHSCQIRCQFIILARKDELTPDFPLSPRVQLMIPETVVAAWPELPEAMPASILAMVKAASLER